jgi:isopenicillin N synthase-like dioxygenase
MNQSISFETLEKIETEGFVTFTLNHQSDQVISSVYDAGYRFFRTASDHKMRHRLPNDFGYRPIGVEYSQSPDRPDPIESFTASARSQSETPKSWSDDGKRLSQSMLQAIDVLEPITDAIITELAFRVGGSQLRNKLRGGLHRWSCLQLNYSRPKIVASGLIHEAHEDGHLLTIACSTAPGLERQVEEEQFVPISTSTHEFVVMPGDIAYLLSGGRIRPLYHRVQTDINCEERMALLFFADVSPDLCDPWVINEVNRNVNIGDRVLSNSQRFGVQAFEAE